MRQVRMMSGLLLATLLCGCAPPALSIHSLIKDPRERVSEPRIEGEWEILSEDYELSGLQLHVKANADGGYDVEFHLRDNNDERPMVTEYAVDLVRLDSHLFFDVLFRNHSSPNNELIYDLPPGVAPLHLIGRVSVEPEFLRIALLDPEWVRSNLPENASAIRVRN